MVFSSMIFLLLFFVLLLVTRFICRTDADKNTALLIASLIVYAWGGLESLLVLFFASAATWYFGNRIDAARNMRAAKTQLKLGIGINIALMVFFRVWQLTPWAADNTAARYVLPMGLAYYSLQLITYLLDIYQEEIRPVRDFDRLLLYASLFPQSAGGPIIRYGDIRRQLNRRRVRSTSFARGILRFSCGLAKKVILADSCAGAVAAFTADGIGATPALGVWMSGIFFMMEVYLDLSAYADMAIGMGIILGFTFPENFDYPYTAVTMREFWHRWNITVTKFFRDYIYIPLGGSARGGLMQILNLFVVWLLFGLWTGSTPNFLFWAVWCLLILLIEKYALGDLDGMPTFVGHFWVLFTTFLGFFFFRFTSLPEMGLAFRGLIGLNGAGFANSACWREFASHLILLVICVLACTPFWQGIEGKLRERAKSDRSGLYLKVVRDAVCPALLLLLSFMAMVGCNISTFLYFQP